MKNKGTKVWIFLLALVLLLAFAPAALAREFTDDGQKYCWHEVQTGDIIMSGADMVTFLDTCEICKENAEYAASNDDFPDDDEEETGICLELESGGYCDAEGKVKWGASLIRKIKYVKEDAHFEYRNASGSPENLYPYADGRKVSSWYVTDTDDDGYDYVRILKGYAGSNSQINDVIAFNDLEQESDTPGGAGSETSPSSSALNSYQDPAKTPTATPTSVPRTGDGSNPGLWIVMFILGLVGVAALAGKNRRKRNE